MRQLNIISVFSIAVATLSACASVAAQEVNGASSLASPGQEQIVRLLEEDFNFEAQKRQLSNQLALEKLRNELNKLKADGQVIPQLSSPAVTDSTAELKPVIATEVPAILLISEVAGLPRILVKDGDNIKLRKPSDIFVADNAKKYKFVSQGSQKFLLKEIQ
ncbi:hypothetical protein [[Enterobacter] lignolyticus]|uniref:Type IV pilus biogenesis protein PilP n=1 Tax=Enterobacter lignolyticus (strain SCF1) TaxID=701347 RepID=E3G6F9_ENTLS|nr:hypothetical protein [[Enterobacter] lignolyticus]ADO47282.1 hypothetical protein Entcl_1010 [[Enterobacter] lignolyticus SCF1]